MSGLEMAWDYAQPAYIVPGGNLQWSYVEIPALPYR